MRVHDWSLRLACCFTLAITGGALATELTGNVNLTAANPVLNASPDSITPIGNVYSWADKNGDGTADDPVSAGLNLTAYSLTRNTETTGFSLNLHNGTANGAITWGGISQGRISTYRETSGDKDGGPITIIGASDVTCAEINASGRGTGNGADIVVSQSGNLMVGKILAPPANNRTSGRIDLGGAGGLTGTPAGQCQVVTIVDNHGVHVKSVTIAGYETVSVGDGGISSWQTGNSLSINSVTITNIGDGGVSVTGPLKTYATGNQGKGDVTIATSGGVSVSGVDTHRGSGGGWVYTDAGSIAIVAGGIVEATGALETYMLGNGTSYSRNSGDIRIVASDGSVKLNSINTTNKTTSAYYAGDVTVTAHRDLMIAGTINLNSARGGSYRGNLALTTSGRGRITLHSLDLALMNNALLASGLGWSRIENALHNFSTAATGGSGTPADPFVASQSQLRVPAGQRLYYTYEAGGLNGYLGGNTYLLRNLDNTGAGGMLTPFVEGAPEIYNVGAVEVGATVAKLVGHLVTGAAPVKVVCYWGLSDGELADGAWDHSVTQQLASAGEVTNALTGLSSSQTYYFRYYATNEVNGVWASDTVLFSTVGAPTADNGGGADNIGDSSVLLHGRVLSGDPSPRAWFYWGTSDGGNNREKWDEEPIDAGIQEIGGFSRSLTGLPANQTFWYRCYVTNAYGEGWAPVSATFTTTPPAVAIANVAVGEGSLGDTTAAVLTVTLSAASATAVSVDYATSNGSAGAPGDYCATNGTLTIPPGALSGTVSVAIAGDNNVESPETVNVNLSNPINATIQTSLGVVTILNDDFNMFVRGDLLGSDANGGTSWSDAWTTLQKALSSVPNAPANRASIPSSVPVRIHVQASPPGQAYDVAARSTAGALDLDFQGGWEDVDGVPGQTGISLVSDTDGNVDEAGLGISGANHHGWRRVVLNRFFFTNIARAVQIAATADSADIFLIASNLTVRALSDGLYINYPKGFSFDGVSGYGGFGQIRACNIDVVAGLGGSGAAVFSDAHWGGSVITAEGVDPVSGAAAFSRLSAPNGIGIYMRALKSDQPAPALVERTVIHDCAGDAMFVSASRPDASGATGSNRVQVALNHCTLADNGGDGLHMASLTTGSWAHTTNSIAANNDGHGIMLEGSGFTCDEGYNVFSDDILMVNGVPQSPSATSSSADPLFLASGAKPYPWYALGARLSPAWRRAADGSHRGAVQEDITPRGTLFIVR